MTPVASCSPAIAKAVSDLGSSIANLDALGVEMKSVAASLRAAPASSPLVDLIPSAPVLWASVAAIAVFVVAYVVLTSRAKAEAEVKAVIARLEALKAKLPEAAAVAEMRSAQMISAKAQG